MKDSKHIQDKTIQCHFISNTHWDREWRYSMQRTNYILVNMMDKLLDIFEKEPAFKSFHMDSQTIPIQDYLRIRPEKEDEIRRLVKEGRLKVGPWFVLPDEFCVGGESLVRNLLLGHRIASGLGGVSKTGYSPFSWGQISQMPQIYRGFGIPMAAFYRGINTEVAPHSEFRWQAPDGSTVVGSRLARRPRYNVWFIIQRPVYFDFEDENSRLVHWNEGNAPFRLADGEFNGLDISYARPKFSYHAENIPERVDQALKEQDGEWTTPHRFWSAGHDSSCPDVREVRLIADCNRALAGRAEVFHSTFEDFQKSVVDNVSDDLVLLKGEMRYPHTPGSGSELYGWVISARMDIKKLNYQTERLLGRYAEPLASFAALLGADYPDGFIDQAWNWLLQNHGHDSIGCCSRDVVPEDMLYRYRQAREISVCVMEDAFAEVAGSIDLSHRQMDDVAVVAWNCLPAHRTEVVDVCLDIPVDLGAEDFELVDEDDRAMTIQKIDSQPHKTVVSHAHDCANMMSMERHSFLAQLPELPGLGYKTFYIRPLSEKKNTIERSIHGLHHYMENEYLKVLIQPNGALDVTEKSTGRNWTDLGYFRDSSETGNPWEHHTVARDEVLTTLGERARIACVCQGPLATVFRVELDWELPRGRSADERRRSKDRVPYKIVNRVTLRKGQPWVEIETTVENTAGDHYLQVSFPTKIDSPTVEASIPFDVVQRDIALPDPAAFDEKPQTEYPMDRFVSVSDGRQGVALINEGLKAYEPHGDSDQTLSFTLLRCFPLRICITNLEMTDYSRLDRGSQCLGTHTFRYAFMPHEGDWEKGGVRQASERFNHNVRVAQIGPSDKGNMPVAHSFLEIRPADLEISAVKKSELGRGWVVRLFNPYVNDINGTIRLNGGMTGPLETPSPVERARDEYRLPEDAGPAWSTVRVVNLEEIPQYDLDTDEKGWAAFLIRSKQILTVEFVV